MENIMFQVEGDKEQAFLSLLYEMQDITKDTINKIVNCYGKERIEISSWVAIVILKRVLECTKAAVILITSGFERDAAILLTNQIELRLDMLYIAQDYIRAKEWINHNNSHRKPWKVSDLFNELYKDKNEYEAEKELYRRFSMVKHGNPVGETMSFPLSIKNGYMTIPPKEDILLGKFALYISAFSSELFRTLKAAICDFNRCGFDVSDYERKADFINLMMNDLYLKNIKEQISLLMEIKPKPELCHSCGYVPAGKIEITCVLRRGESSDNFYCNKYIPR